MDLYDEFAVDEKRLQDGVWHVIESATKDYPVAEGEIGSSTAVLIAGTDSPKYRHFLQKKMRPHYMRRGADIDPEVQERLMGEAVAECVILDWRNWTVQGETWPFTKARVLEIWNNPRWVKLKERLMAIMNETEVFKAVQEELVQKNS